MARTRSARSANGRRDWASSAAGAGTSSAREAAGAPGEGLEWPVGPPRARWPRARWPRARRHGANAGWGARPSGEDNRLVLMDDDPIVQMPAHRASEHRPLDMAAKPPQVVGRATVVDADNVLLDDGARVKLGGHVMRGRTDKLDAALGGGLVRVGADEGRKETVVDVDDRLRVRGEKPWRQDLHVPGEHHKIHFFAQQFELR